MQIRPIAVGRKADAVDVVIALPHDANRHIVIIVIIDCRGINNIRRHSGGIMFRFTAPGISRINTQPPVRGSILFAEGHHAIAVVANTGISLPGINIIALVIGGGI